MAFSGTGTGIALDPYVITTATQLQEMENDLSSFFVLGNDIDATDTVNWNSGDGFAPVGSETSPFTGQLDGVNYTISGLFINRPSLHQGLFMYLSGAYITDIRFSNADITGNRAAVVAAYALNTTNIVGIVISSCTVNGTDFGGAGIARNVGTSSIIYRCLVLDSSIHGSRLVGAIGAYVDGGASVSDCYSNSDISQTATSGTRYCGGMIGQLFSGECYNNIFTGSISGTFNVGGLIGQASYSTIAVNLAAVSSQNMGNGVFGLQSNNSVYTELNWWDMESAGIYFDDSGMGLTTSQAKNLETYTLDGISIATYANYIDETWKIDDGVSYPILGYMPIEEIGDITGSVSLVNGNALFVAYGEVEKRSLSATLQNTPQALAIQVTNTISVSLSISNQTQTLQSTVVVFISSSIVLHNTTQGFASSSIIVISTQAPLVNNPQLIQASGVLVINTVVSLENVPQTFSASSGFIVYGSVSLENGFQSLQGAINNIVSGQGTMQNQEQTFTSSVALFAGIVTELTNRPQIITGDGVVLIHVAASIINSPQIFSASSCPFANASVFIENSPQIVSTAVGVLVRGSVILENNSQTFHASGADQIGVSVSLINQSQELIGTIEIPDLNIVGALVNQPQSLNGDLSLILLVSAVIENNPQLFSASSGSIGLNIYVGVRKVVFIYYQNKTINQLQI